MNEQIKTKSINQCQRCVMDTTAADITFDSNGFCNYCDEFIKQSKNFQKRIRGNPDNLLNELVDKIKYKNRNKPYDCVVGVSGGIDSSWTLVKVREIGLRPLAVHMDNGWNSQLAQNNISNLVKKLNIDLHTYVIDWAEYKNLMQSFFDADVIDIELLYDNAMLAVNYRMAAKYGLNYILAGTNHATEGMKMPPNWNWYKYDKKNIRNIAKRNNVVIKSFPLLSIYDTFYYSTIKKIQWVSFLDYIDYNKEDAIRNLEENFNFIRYPYKHYESIFTRFYQGYILPEKFNVDKRKLHLSSLIMSGQLKREEALSVLEGQPYEDQNELKKDIQYFLKKMGWTSDDLNQYLKREEMNHSEYGSDLDQKRKVLWLQKLHFATNHPIQTARWVFKKMNS